jgi:hypothetical protein
MSAVLEEAVMEETRLARLQSDVGGLKTDIREIRSVLGSLNAVVAALRDEMHVADDGLRLEMRTGFAELRHEMMRISLSQKIWTLSVAGTLLAGW